MGLAEPMLPDGGRSIHGHLHEDPYRWLNSSTNERVITHILNENRRVDQETKHLQELQNSLMQEFRASTPEKDADLPTQHGEWWYYGYILNGQQYPRVRRVRACGEDQLTPDPAKLPDELQEDVLDFNTLVPEDGYLGMGGFDFCESGDRFIYSIDLIGCETYTLHVRDLPAEQSTSDPELVEIGPGAVLTPDGNRILYTKRNDSWRCDTIWEHEIGSDQSTDRLVYQEVDERFHLTFRISRSRRYLAIHAESRTTTEELLLDLTSDETTVAPVWPRRDGIKYTAEHLILDHHDRLLVLHNTDEEPEQFVLTETDLLRPLDQTGWHRVLTPETGIQLLGIEAFEQMVVLSVKSESHDRIAVIRLGSEADERASASTSRLGLSHWATTAGYVDLHVIELGDSLVETRSLSNQRWEQRRLRLHKTSYAYPSAFVEYDPESRTYVTLRSHKVPSHGSFDQYAQKQIWATAEDGAQIPISLVWNREAVGDSPAPLILYVYGAYGMSIQASFEPTRLSLLDRGIVCAIAHVRGGGELGPAWHDAGKLFAKKNTFTDAIACARDLIARGIAAPNQIVIEGGSAGGLTVGAAANMAPELFAGVIAEVPFVDPLNTLLDPSSPLTVTEWEEWGNPLASAEAYEYIRSYSPYENIPSGTDFPRVLALTSMFDARVSYSEAAKWVNRLRDHGVDALLHVEQSGGHTRVSGREAAYEAGALVFAWLIDTLSIDHEPIAQAPSGKE